MNDREREQLNLIMSHDLVTCKRSLEERITAVFAEHAASGRLHSGATVKVSIRAMHEVADALLTDIGAKAKSVAQDRDAFDLLSTTVTDFLEFCTEVQLLPVIKMASGRMQGTPDVSVVRAANDLFDAVRTDIKSKLAILAFEFEGAVSTSVQSPTAQAAALPSPPPRKGGRPPAKFWDDMWAAIAVALYTGELQPKSQADVERAMSVWIEENGHSAVVSTVRGRARRLWDSLAALEE